MTTTSTTPQATHLSNQYQYINGVGSSGVRGTHVSLDSDELDLSSTITTNSALNTMSQTMVDAAAVGVNVPVSLDDGDVAMVGNTPLNGMMGSVISAAAAGYNINGGQLNGSRRANSTSDHMQPRQSKSLLIVGSVARK
jgi:hypothetical protein